jgi:tetratricopeptide (TPR) repeat protein
MPAMSHLQRNAARLVGLSAAAILLLGVSTAALAQAPAAEPRAAITVSGTVRDPSGAAIADASIFFQEKGTSAYVEDKTKSDGSFSFLALRPGTYVLRARKEGFQESSETIELSLGQKKQLDLVLKVGMGGGVMGDKPRALAEPSASKTGEMEFSDKPSFTVAGVTDWTNVGGHGSDTKLRTSESLAKETAALKSAEPDEASANTSEAARAADSHRELGDRAERSGDPLAAEREYEEAVRLNPSEENYFAWGTELLVHRAVKPAAEVFEKGTTAHPKSARMLAGLGAALYASGDYANAARRVCAAADVQPADPTPYLFLGKMEKAAPDPLPCAAEKLARFAHDQPTNALANYYFAVSLWKRAQRNESVQYLQKTESLLRQSIAVNPKLDEAYVQLGMVYAARANFPQAIETYKKAVEINPQSTEAHYRLSQAYKRVGDEAKSEQELQLYKQADKTETAAIEQQRREIRQFLIILKDQPQNAAPAAEKKDENKDEKNK